MSEFLKFQPMIHSHYSQNVQILFARKVSEPKPKSNQNQTWVFDFPHLGCSILFSSLNRSNYILTEGNLHLHLG